MATKVPLRSAGLACRLLSRSSTICWKSCNWSREFGGLSHIRLASYARISRRASSWCKDGRRSYVSTTASSAEQKTALYDLHVRHGAKMVPFGGFSMPVVYNDLGIGESHNWTREKASLFDVGHMVQHFVKGPGAQGWLQRFTPAGLAALPPHKSTLSVMLHRGTGGIVDDTVITRIGPESFYFVTNAGCREKDLKFLKAELDDYLADGNEAVDWTCLDREKKGLIALQGPLSAEIVEPLLIDYEDKLAALFFGQSVYVKLRLSDGKLTQPLLISRGGYTGEDGFEISIAAEDTVPVVETLLASAGPHKLRLAGLGARDSLRLEAGMCLYGHDLDESTTPIEGGLAWVVDRARRLEANFNGAEVILEQLKPKKDGGAGVERKRVGLIVEGAPAREGADIVDADGNHIGKVTSGCPSPTMKKNIAMGYVKTAFQKAGTEVGVVVRGKQRKATISKMPFVPSKYWKGGVTPG